MSSFVTNSNTRAAKRAKTSGFTHTQQVNSAPVPISEELTHNFGISKSTRESQASYSYIGTHASKGLVILGGNPRLDYNRGTNPDGLDVPIAPTNSLDSMHEPAFPISYNGVGHLKFLSPIEIPGILGLVSMPQGINGALTVSTDLTVGNHIHTSGDLHVTGTITSDNPIVAGLTAPTPTTVSLEDLSANVVDGLTQTVTYIPHVDFHLFTLEVSWTGLGSASGAMIITGWPYSDYIDCDYPISMVAGIFSTVLGSQFVLRTSPEGLRLYETFPSSGATATPVTEAQMLAAGTIRCNGMLRRTS